MNAQRVKAEKRSVSVRQNRIFGAGAWPTVDEACVSTIRPRETIDQSERSSMKDSTRFIENYIQRRFAFKTSMADQ